MISSPLMRASLTRIADFDAVPFQIEPVPRAQWGFGDYVVGSVSVASRSFPIELTTGRLTEVTVGDLVMGAFGVRAATLETVGSWKLIAEDGRMEALNAAGMFGRISSRSTFLPRPLELEYVGHVVRDGVKLRMQGFAVGAGGPARGCPVVLLIGTSMSSGKTSSARVIIRRLKQLGQRVVGAKFTGAGRYRDIQAMSDSGADAIFDFVDAGLPSTVCPRNEYGQAIKGLLSRIATARPDVLVAEAGASPLEPYNGDTAMKILREQVACTVLCASDPYAVVGVTKGFGFHPDLVAGVATSTSAGVEVIRKLAEVEAMNLLDPASHPELDRLLVSRLSLDRSASGGCKSCESGAVPKPVGRGN